MSSFLKLLRPIHWFKNIFVFTGIIFYGISDVSLFLDVLKGAVAFSLAASSTYAFNDLIDLEQDRHHPTKKHRPIASNQITPTQAIIIALTLVGLSLLLAYTISWTAVVILCVYLTVNLLYSLWLKSFLIIDVFCTSFGFVLRILMGTIGVGLPSLTLLTFSCFTGMLCLGFSKRRAELFALESKSDAHRKVLKDYSPAFLDQLIAVTTAMTLTTYTLFALDFNAYLIWTVPVITYALFRYIYRVYAKISFGEPVRDIVMDKLTLLTVSVCFLMILFVMHFL